MQLKPLLENSLSPHKEKKMNNNLPENYEPPVVKLIGADGNAFAIMGKVTNVLKKAGYRDLVKQYQQEAMSGDYNHLLQVSMKYCDVS